MGRVIKYAVYCLFVISAVGVAASYSGYQENKRLKAEIETLKKAQTEAKPEPQKLTGGDVIAVRPLEHDGHRFVIVVTQPGGVALVHHPDCRCGKVH